MVQINGFDYDLNEYDGEIDEQYASIRISHMVTFPGHDDQDEFAEVPTIDLTNQVNLTKVKIESTCGMNIILPDCVEELWIGDNVYWLHHNKILPNLKKLYLEDHGIDDGYCEITFPNNPKLEEVEINCCYARLDMLHNPELKKFTFCDDDSSADLSQNHKLEQVNINTHDPDYCENSVILPENFDNNNLKITDTNY